MKIYELENNKHKWKNDINDKMTVQAFNVNLWFFDTPFIYHLHILK